MHPILLQIGSIKIHSYGVFVALGVLAAIWVSGREADRRGLDRERFYDMAFWAVVSAVVGARLFHVLVYWDFYGANPAEILKIWNGGLVFYGGFLAAFAACFVFLRRHGMPFLAAADAAAFGIPLGLALGRIGCTAAGCCYGKLSVVPWAVVYTNPASLAPLHVPLHPTQIYESLGALAIFGILIAAKDRFRTPGMAFWALLILYGAVRSFLELFRDDPRGFLGPLSESQIVSGILIAYAVAAIVHARIRGAAKAP